LKFEVAAMMRLPTLILASIVLTPAILSAQDRDTTETQASDAALTARVKAALIDHEATKARQIQVETSSGAVQLSGFVDSEMDVETALKVARSVPGVREVNNGLDLRAPDRTAGEVSKDGVIEAKVKAEIARDEGLATASDINVEVDAGIVQLSGFLPSLEQKNRARDAATRVSGIRDVRNNIAVEEEQ
jgi:hyperosmotically inducible periplasmic protein